MAGAIIGRTAARAGRTATADSQQPALALNVSFYFDHLTITMHYNLLRKEPCTFFVHICLFVGWHLTSYTPSSTPQLLVSESAPLRDKWLLISRKKTQHGRGNCARPHRVGGPGGTDWGRHRRQQPEEYSVRWRRRWLRQRRQRVSGSGRDGSVFSYDNDKRCNVSSIVCVMLCPCHACDLTDLLVTVCET